MGYQYYARVNIPCGSKVIPAIYELNCERFYEDRPNMILKKVGSSQCSLSERANLSVFGNGLEINSYIQVPVAPAGMMLNALGLVYKLNRIGN